MPEPSDEEILPSPQNPADPAPSPDSQDSTGTTLAFPFGAANESNTPLPLYRGAKGVIAVLLPLLSACLCGVLALVLYSNIHLPNFSTDPDLHEGLGFLTFITGAIVGVLIGIALGTMFAE